MELGLSPDGKPSWAERMLALRDDPSLGLGPFRLAFLEALLRAADMRASRNDKPESEPKGGVWRTMREIELRGCNAEPLMSYLKALGVLRVVAEQADKRARGAWRHSHFVFSSKLNPDGLASFFLNDYRPTPVVVPWSGNDFFNVSAIRATEPLKTTPTSSKIIRAFLTTKGDRLEVYRRALEKTLLIIRDMEITKKDIEGNSDKAK